MLATTVIAGAFALAAAATPVLAQTAPASAKDADTAEVEAVVVTGSRIKRNEFNSPSPVTVITTESAELRGLADTASILQASIMGSTAQQINNNFTGFVTTGGNGANTLSLRGLGAQRSLTLINGRRAGPAGIGGTVGPFDLNTIPGSLVDRVEILSGGASSIYGSDAISGVVNIFTKSRTDEGEINAFATVPFSKGGEEYRFSASKGWKFDRGYVTAAGELYQNRGLRFKDRDYLNCPQDYTFDPVTGDRRDLRMADGSFKCLNTLTGLYIRGSSRYIADPTAVANGFDLNGYRRVNASIATLAGDINPNVADVQPIYAALIPGCAGQTATTTAAILAACPQALDFARANQAIQPTDSKLQGYRHAISPVDRYSLFFTGGFDLTPDTQLYGEVLLNRRESAQRSIRQIGPSIAAGNPTNPFNVVNNPSYNNGPYGALAASAVSPIFVLPVTRDQKVDYKRFVLGAKGLVPEIGFLKNWDWDIYGQYSKSSGDYGQDFIYNDRLLAVSGAAQCNQALVTISANAPNATCPANVNLNKLSTVGSSYLTPEEYAFLNGYEQGHTTYTNKYVEGSVSGDLFRLPAGPLGMAAGFQLRKESINDQPGFNSRNSNYSASAASGPTVGDDTIKEVFGELEAPLLRELPFADKVILNLSGRYSDYKSYGSSKTYKAGLNWQVTPSWMVRATKGTSFRAPALYELYLGASSSFLAQLGTDPCYQYATTAATTDRERANCAAQGIGPNATHGGAGSMTVLAKGGLGYLKAEKSDAQSIGVVWTPKFIDLRVALDYSEIQINNQVQRYGTANILKECYDSADFPNNPFCSLISRNLDTTSPTFGAVLTVADAYLNVAKQWNHALDLSAEYRRDLPRGKLTVTGQFTWQLEWYTQLNNGSAPNKNQGFTGFPDFAGNTAVRYELGDYTFTWATQMAGKTSDVDDSYSGFGTDIITYRDQLAYVKRHIEFNATHDVSVRKKFEDFSVTAGVSNLFDEQPPFYSTSGASRFSNMRLTSQYDLIGRRAFVSLKKLW